VNRHVYFYDPKGPVDDHPKSYYVLSFWSAGTRGDCARDRSYLSILIFFPELERLKIQLVIKKSRTSFSFFAFHIHLAPIFDWVGLKSGYGIGKFVETIALTLGLTSLSPLQFFVDAALMIHCARF
jgi:hypothetical protein